MDTPGYYPDATWEEYLASPAISRTNLVSLIDCSPSKAHHKATRETPESPAQAFGSLAHTLILEPGMLEERYLVVDDAELLTKKGEVSKKPKGTEAWKAALSQAEAADKDLIRAGELREAEDFAETFKAKPGPKKLMGRDDGRAEVSAVAEIDGQLVKARADWLIELESGFLIVDLKTTVDSTPRGFAKSVAKWHYHIQDALYTDVFVEALGRTCLGFFFVTVEKEPPYDVGLHTLDEDSREIGRNGIHEEYREAPGYRQLLAEWADRTERNDWPDSSETPTRISLPGWYGKQ